MNDPLVSVITVVYNDVNSIEKTIQSVIGQSYKSLEYIVVDGESNDGTLNVIESYRDHIDSILSEKDAGVYDAMNKGINLATGMWLIFMNSGDEFYNLQVIESFFSAHSQKNADILYGDVCMKYEYGKRLIKPLCLDKLRSKMIFSHQSTFVKTQLHKENLFDLKYKIAADYNFFHKMYTMKCIFEYIPILVSSYDAVTGLSAKRCVDAYRENAIISGEYKQLSWSLKYFLFASRVRVRDILNKLLPDSAYAKVKRMFHKI